MRFHCHCPRGLTRALTTTVGLAAGLGAIARPAAAQLSFPLSATLSTGARPVSVTAGNFTGHTDGRLDLATADETGRSVTIITFDTAGTPTTFAFPLGANTPRSVFAAEMTCVTGDEIIIGMTGDLNYLSRSPAGVWSIAPIQEGAIGGSMYAIAARFDTTSVITGTAAIRSSNETVVTRRSGSSPGDGCGGYGGAAGSYTAGVDPVVLAVASANPLTDAFLDLLVLNYTSGTVSVYTFINYDPPFGAINFNPPTTVPIGSFPIALAVGRLNSDAFDDFAVICDGDDTLRTFYGDGIGGFAAGNTYRVPRGPVELAIADLNGDGKHDIAVASTGSWGSGTAAFSPIGFFPGSTAFESFATGLSGSGSHVVGYGDSTSGRQAFSWANGTLTGLGDLSGGTFDSMANAASSGGSLVVGHGTNASGQQATSWAPPGAGIGLSDLAGGAFLSAATGCSSSGTLIVGYGTSSSGQEAFRYGGGGGLIALGDLPGGTFGSAARAVSGDGSIIVGEGHSTRSGSGTEAFRWTQATGMVGLGDLPAGAFNSSARGISVDGGTIVGQGRVALTNLAFAWTKHTGMVQLPYPGGSSGSSANDASLGGAVIVGKVTLPAGDFAYRWTPGAPPQSIASLLSAQGATGTAGWTFQDVVAVSDDGTALAGNGTLAGRRQAWFAKLDFPPTATVLINDGLGMGNFSPAAVWPIGNEPSGMVIARVGTEAYPAVIIASAGDSNVKVYRNMLACPVDIDRNGQIQPADLSAFVNQWSASLTGATLAGDWDGSGAVEPADVSAYVGQWFAAVTGGC